MIQRRPVVPDHRGGLYRGSDRVPNVSALLIGPEQVHARDLTTKHLKGRSRGIGVRGGQWGLVGVSRALVAAQFTRWLPRRRGDDDAFENASWFC